MPLLTLTLYDSLHQIFGTAWGLFGLAVSLTVIGLFAMAFSGYEPGDGGGYEE